VQLRYRPSVAQAKAEQAARRPKPGKLGSNPRLHAAVTAGLQKRWSPEQISRTLRSQFPGDPEMKVSHETIYQALYVQGRGELRRELTRCLRTGRALRKPRRLPDQRRRRAHVPPELLISHRPAEAADRAVPGHWEGDLILGKDNNSAVGTLVERSTRFVLLLHLPARHTADAVRDAMITKIGQLPAQIRRSMTWDQGNELAGHAQITIAIGLPIYFCDPHSPWQRGTNENVQRAAAPIPAQGHQPRRAHRGRPRRHRRRTQRTTPQDTRLDNPRPGPRSTTVQPLNHWCCVDPLNPRPSEPHYGSEVRIEGAGGWGVSGGACAGRRPSGWSRR
jgi:IS30 family transposase